MTNDLKELFDMQLALQEKHKDEWDELTPENARGHILWMIDELGEAIAIIKKRGDRQIMENADVRAHYIEECCDVLMYYIDMCLCYGIGPDDIKEAFRKKYEYNMKRDWHKQNDAMFDKEDDA